MTEKKPRKHLVIHVKTAKNSCDNMLVLGAAIDALAFATKLEIFALVLLGKFLTCAGLGSIYFARYEDKNPAHHNIKLPIPGTRKRKPKKES